MHFSSQSELTLTLIIMVRVNKYHWQEFIYFQPPDLPTPSRSEISHDNHIIFVIDKKVARYLFIFLEE